MRVPPSVEAYLHLRRTGSPSIWRHTLQGFSPQDAERAALRDLGSPHAIARDLTRLHSAPGLLRATLLLGVAGVLSVQAAAQLPMIHASQVPLTEVCRYDEAKLARFSAGERAMLLKGIQEVGGRANYEAACRARQANVTLNDLLRISDLTSAMRAAHIEVRSLPGLDTYLQLRLPGQDWQGLNLTGSTIAVPSTTNAGTTSGDLYVRAADLINQLRHQFRGSVSLRGLVNPILRIGPAQMQLGTVERPVSATNLYGYAVLEDFEEMMSPAVGASPFPTLYLVPDNGKHPENTKLELKAPAGVYALFGTADGHVELMVQALEHGQLELPCDCSSLPFKLTGDLKTLLRLNAQKKMGLMIYAVNVTNLHQLTFTPVPPAQIQMVSHK